MGSVGAALAGAVPDGTAESVADEGDRERDLLRAPIRLRLAALARQLPAAADGLRLVPAAARRLRSGAAEPPSGHARPRAGFAVQPRRWVVERFFAWIGRNRRLAKDFEATLESARAFLYAASIMLLTRRLAQSG